VCAFTHDMFNSALWRAYWGGGQLDPTSDESIIATLSPCVEDAAGLLRATASVEVKKRLEECVRCCLLGLLV
jgi:hypothetical protein